MADGQATSIARQEWLEDPANCEEIRPEELAFVECSLDSPTPWDDIECPCQHLHSFLKLRCSWGFHIAWTESIGETHFHHRLPKTLNRPEEAPVSNLELSDFPQLFSDSRSVSVVHLGGA